MSDIKQSYYKYCIVPLCTNTTTNCSNKIFFSVPKDPSVRKTWTNAMKRDDKLNPKLSYKSSLFVCEDHFSLKDDMENYIEWRVTKNVKTFKLIKGTVPHRFDCQNRNNHKPIERNGAKKRKHIALIEEALALPVASASTELSRKFQDILPVDYEYTTCEWSKVDGKHFECRFRVNVSTKEKALSWLNAFQVSSKTFYTKDRTYAENTQSNIYKISLKCHHNTRPRTGAQAHSKHTNCPARLIITVKRTALSRKTYESSDIHLQEFPMIVIYRNRHNHNMDSADALKYHSPNSEVTDIFASHFQDEKKKDILKEFHDIGDIIATKAVVSDSTLQAIGNFAKNFKKLKTESSLNSALNCFGQISGISSNQTRKLLIPSENIGVQPTALVRQKTLCDGQSTVQSSHFPKRKFTQEKIHTGKYTHCEDTFLKIIDVRGLANDIHGN